MDNSNVMFAINMLEIASARLHFTPNAIGCSITNLYSDIIGICEEDDKLTGVGNAINFLRSSLGFFLCIVLPLILFFIFELYNFLKLVLKEKAKKAPVSAETEEEIKRRAVEEYIKAQEAAKAAENAAAEQSSDAKEEKSAEQADKSDD